MRTYTLVLLLFLLPVLKDLGIYFQDETGKKLAGLIGNTHGNWLFVKYLWVSEELRGQNIGSQILVKALTGFDLFCFS